MTTIPEGYHDPTAARDHVHAQGQLGDDVDYGRVTVAVGDRIICRRN
ncbi:MAG: hypothetical protein QOJ29_1021 [Thermoleophilaceae bacterium]|nr:hypothetical protein [Thermoleophilaceae bacterium]